MKTHYLAGGAVLCAALAIPAIASAHSVAVTCDPVTHQATAQGASFPVSPLVTGARLTIDGVVGPVIPVSIPGPNPRFTFPTPIFGAHTLVAQFTNGGPWTSPATQVNCGVAPPPVVPPVTPPAPGPPPPVVTPPTVALVPPLVVKPKPKVAKPKPKRPRHLTCAFFKRTHPNAGPRAYAKLGLRYYVCNVPVARRTMPPVTG